MLTPTETEVRFVADEELKDLLIQMKEKLGNPGISTQELLKKTLKKALGIKASRAESPAKTQMLPRSSITSPGEVKLAQPNLRREHIPASIRRGVAARARHQCTYVSPLAAKRCTQTHALQIEHLIPFAKGGTSHLENLTLLCPAHNRLRAVESYGDGKMARYLKS